MKKDVQIVVVTYNPFHYFENGIHEINGIIVMVVANIFNPKPVIPSEVDENFQLILTHKSTIKHVILFAGKESSGTFALIDIFCKFFKENMHFVLCPHQWRKKRNYLKKKGVLSNQCIGFIDCRVEDEPTLQCNEAQILLGVLYACIDQL